jgi:hypothetical protein
MFTYFTYYYTYFTNNYLLAQSSSTASGSYLLTAEVKTEKEKKN